MASQSGEQSATETLQSGNAGGLVKKIAIILGIVLAITIIIAVVLSLTSTDPGTKRDVQRKADIEAIAGALEKYRQTTKDQLYYPSAPTETTLVKTGFLAELPKDPINNSPYSYTYIGHPSACITDCTGYTLNACLENAQDKGENTTGPVAPCMTRTYQVTK